MKIALIGYGKMGKEIEEIAVQKGHSIALIIDANNLEDLNTANLKKCDVAIEFTHPESAAGNIEKCLRSGTPVVSGTTGWMQQFDSIKKICSETKGAFLYASNFSIGVNIFFEINKRLAEMMSNQPDYSLGILEIHHTQKKDAPSGTAITLAEQILDKYPNKKRWVNHPADSETELEILSERKDPFPGLHKITYHSQVDDIEIVHTAHNRKGFASGAVLGAEFIIGKKGSFSMKDVLGL